MRLGWDEIKRRAKAFSEDWKDAHYEKGETQTFYNEFFEKIFGINRRQVAIYEQRVRLLTDRHGFIDLFWPGTLLVEQKSSRLDLGKAQGQALDYVEGIHPTLQPRHVLTCDFQNWVLLDLETRAEIKFRLARLHQPREQTVRHVHVSEGGQAVIADQFHHHGGSGENAKSVKQSHATGAADQSPPMFSQFKCFNSP